MFDCVDCDQQPMTGKVATVGSRILVEQPHEGTCYHTGHVHFFYEFAWLDLGVKCELEWSIKAEFLLLVFETHDGDAEEKTRV